MEIRISWAQLACVALLGYLAYKHKVTIDIKRF